MCIRDRNEEKHTEELERVPQLEARLGEIRPVSYTHLDVYKRQAWGSKGDSLGASLPPFSAPRKEVASRPDPFFRACWCLSELQLVAAKVGKNAPGGSPGPQIAGRFSFYENRRQREYLNQRL